MLMGIDLCFFKGCDVAMRLLCPALAGLLLLTLPARGAPLDQPAQVRLTKPCDRPAPGGCIVHVSLEGTITPETPGKLVAVLNEEMRRINAPVVSSDQSRIGPCIGNRFFRSIGASPEAAQ